MFKRITPAVVLVLLSGVFTLGFGASAYAHASLTGVNPESGSVLTETPEKVVFTFNEVLKEPGFAAVSHDGKEVTDWSVSLDAERLIVSPPANSTVPAGEYVISFRVVSADGHPIKGSTDFTIQAEESAATHSPEPTPEAPVVDSEIESDEPGGFAALLRAPWLWGGIVIVVAVVAVALLRRSTRSDDDTPRT